MTRVVVVLLLLAGCGPAGYVRGVTLQASRDVEAARRAQADRYAPYWYALAVAYLAKAREEGSQAAFAAASRLGKKASAAAGRALGELTTRPSLSAPPPGAR